MANRPNIVLVVVDDLGWRDLSCYGSSFYETPVLDRLASGGLLFTDAYAASPVCSPTRASLLTGRYPARVGVTQWIGGHAVGRLCDVPYFPFLPSQELTLARVLRGNGYQTWHVGKWHLGARDSWPDRHGFDINIGGCEWGRPMHGYFSPYGCPALEDGPPGEYLTDRLTDEAIALIRDRERRPFFLNFWSYAVHTPIEAPEDLVDKYRKKAEHLGIGNADVLQEGEPFPCWHKRGLRVRRRTLQSDPAYAAMIENLDWNIGRLLAELERSGAAEDTIVVFTSDNGGLATAEGSPTSNVPLSEGKGWMNEGGLRVPLIVRWPGVIEPGRRSSVPVTTPDLYATVVGAALTQFEQQGADIDGVSLIPVFEGSAFERGPIFWHYPHYSNQGGEPTAAVRDHDWKLIRFYDGSRSELYNLSEDVSETDNLAATHQELRLCLDRKLDEWGRSVGCLVPRRNPNEPFEDFAGTVDDVPEVEQPSDYQ